VVQYDQNDLAALLEVLRNRIEVVLFGAALWLGLDRLLQLDAVGLATLRGDLEELLGVLGIIVQHHPVLEEGRLSNRLLDVAEEVAVLDLHLLRVDVDLELVDIVSLDAQRLAQRNAALLLAQTVLDLLGVFVDAAHARGRFQLSDLRQVLLELYVVDLVVQKTGELAQLRDQVKVVYFRLPVTVFLSLFVDQERLAFVLYHYVVSLLIVVQQSVGAVSEFHLGRWGLLKVYVMNPVDSVISVISYHLFP